MSYHLHSIKVLTLALLLAFVCLVQVNAQSTTSSVTGTATDADGILPGAVITLVHVPSGTQYATIANQKGQFRLEGLRTGGPYRLEATYVGHNKTIVNIQRLLLGDVHEYDVQLEMENNLREVVVAGNRAAERKDGSSENFSAEELNNIPSTDRRIEDVLRFSPYYQDGGVFSSLNPSMNNYSIDGANFNFNMGLDNNRMPGGGNAFLDGYSGTPFSMESLSEIQIVNSAFDVKNSNFLGASVNAVTKSGTNTFKAVAYTAYRDEHLRGNRIDGQYLGARAPQQCNTYGLSLSGPILKDKLFFYVNAEWEHVPRTIHYWQLSEDGKENGANNISRVTAEDMKRFANDLKTMYGWDPGSIDDFEGENDYFRLMTRIDWNINQNHKLMVRYNQVNTSKDNNITSPGLGCNDGRTSIYSQIFRGSTWAQKDNVYSLTAELNSRLGDNMNNKLLASFTFNDANNRECDANFPTIEIMKTYDGDGQLHNYMTAGYDPNAWNNGIKEKSWNVVDNFTMSVDNHFLTFGGAFEAITSDNCYMKYGAGYYRYASYDDFLNKRAPVAFAMSWSLTGEERARADVSYNRFSLYAQDEWKISKRLRLLYGIRMDLPMYVNDRYENPSIADINFNGQRLDTKDWPKAVPLFSPRVGFNYSVTEDESVRLRGGTGIFTGRFPFILLSKMQEGSGMLQTNVQVPSTATDNAKKTLLSYLDGKGVLTPQQVLTQVVPNLPENLQHLFPTQAGAQANIESIDKNFKMPQIWKSTLAVDWKMPLPFPAELTVEGTFAKNINALIVRDLNVDAEKVESRQFSGPDDRYYYPGGTQKRYFSEEDNKYVYSGYAYELTNTNKGYSASIMAQLKAEPVRNLHLMAAYTYNISKTAMDVKGNNLSTIMTQQPTVNGYNYTKLMNSRYLMTPHRLIASASYRFNDRCQKASTQVTLFYEGRYNNTYSHVYTWDMNNDGVNMDLIYVPATKDEIRFEEYSAGGKTFTVEEQQEAFWKFINQDPYLKTRKGQYAEAWGAYNPWFNQVDLKLSREYRFKVGKSINRLQFNLDILNIGNLINSSWGCRKAGSAAGWKPLVKAGKAVVENVVDGVKTYTPVYRLANYKDEKGETKLIDHTFDVQKNANYCWQMQIGVKYYFN